MRGMRAFRSSELSHLCSTDAWQSSAVVAAAIKLKGLRFAWLFGFTKPEFKHLIPGPPRRAPPPQTPSIASPKKNYAEVHLSYPDTSREREPKTTRGDVICAVISS